MAPTRQIAGCLRGFTSTALRASALRTALGATLLCAAAASAAQADSVSDFYAGKTLTLLIGFPPGGGYDTYVRVLARYYGKFIPGPSRGGAFQHAGRGLALGRQLPLRQGPQ